MAVAWKFSLSIGRMAIVEKSLTADMWRLVTHTFHSMWHPPAITNMNSLRIFDVIWNKNSSRQNLSGTLKFCNVFIRIATFTLLTPQSKVSHLHLWQGEQTVNCGRFLVSVKNYLPPRYDR